MPDNQDDHWDFLAADLGTPPPADEEPEQEKSESSDADVESDVVEEPHDELLADDLDEVAEADLDLADEDLEDSPPEKPRKPQSGGKGDRVVSGFGHRRGNVDWANLAQELGVEAMEEAPAPIPAAETPAESQASPIFDEEPVDVEPAMEQIEQIEPVDVEPAMEQIEPVEAAPEQLAPLPEPAVAGFGAGIIEDASSESTSEAPEEGSGADEVQEERKGRRRRRRRKPRKKESTEEQQPVEAVIVEEEEAEAKSPPQEQEEEEEKERPRHRGRRRGGRKRAPREEATEEPEQFGAGLAVDDANLDDDDDDFEIFDAEDDEDDESTGTQGGEGKDHGQERRSKKVTHRGIPNWDEAVGHIIDSNLEDRSKRPDSGGSRQRSGRRRGGDRSGNRGRS